MKTVKYLQKIQIAQNAWTFFFERPENFTFRAGQYISLILPKIEEKSLSHFFTISSPPHIVDQFTITVVKSDSDFKKVLFDLPNNTEVNYLGPTGAFVLKDDSTPLVMLAGGIGITPFISMIKDNLQRKITTPITLIASFSTFEQIAFKDFLFDVDEEIEHIKTIVTITKPGLSNTIWQGDTGRIRAELIQKYIPDIKKPTYLIVGSPTMVLDVEELLLDMGVALEQIREEQFTGY